MHGLGLSCESFQPQLDGLSYEFNVIAWNMPDLGKKDPKEMNFQNLANAGFKLMDSLNVETCHLVGHSMGGMIALEMALQDPNRITSITLLGATSAFGGKDDTFKEAFLKARLEPLNNGLSMQDIAKINVPSMFSKDSNPTYIANSIAKMGKISVNDYKVALECLTTFNRRYEASQIQQPCCLIAGSHDLVSPPKTIKKMAEVIKNSEYHLIENCGHMIQLDKPRMTNWIIRKFIKNLTIYCVTNVT